MAARFALIFPANAACFAPVVFETDFFVAVLVGAGGCTRVLPEAVARFALRAAAVLTSVCLVAAAFLEPGPDFFEVVFLRVEVGGLVFAWVPFATFFVVFLAAMDV